jgi:xylulokinase
VIWTDTVQFDTELSEYKTSGGVLRDADDPLAVTAPSLMFVSAIDLLLKKLSQSPLHTDEYKRIAAISGSGQQHGSVYWTQGAANRLAALDGSNCCSDSANLATQLTGVFNPPNGPIWMDSSTASECQLLEEKMGGPHVLAALSGSRAYERFTGNQIAKLWCRKYPSILDNCERISLVSSLIACIFAGTYAPIDSSDGSGMNLMDICSNPPVWSNELLGACVPESASAEHLRTKLGDAPVPAHSCVGHIHSYFCDRYGFSPECKIIACSGDNPCSLVGLLLHEPGDVAISLGTSDTLFAVVADPHPSGDEGHVLLNPVDPNSFMSMLVYKNGSLTRQKVRDTLPTCSGSWQSFNQLLASSPPGNNGRVAFFFMEPEITPIVNESCVQRYDNNDHPIAEFKDASTEVRALIEGQALSLRLHSQNIGLDHPKRIIATGGASQNTYILQILADVFGTSVYTMRTGENSAAFGAALRSMHGYHCSQNPSGFVSFRSMMSSRLPSIEHDAFVVAAVPNMTNHAMYEHMVTRYGRLERTLLDSRSVGDSGR